MKRVPPQAVFLAAEALALAACVIWRGPSWLLPGAGLLILLAFLHTRRLSAAGILLSLAASAAWIFFRGTLPDSPPGTAHAVIALLAGTACAFLGILSSLSKTKPHPVLSALGRIAVILHFAAAGAFLAAPYAPFPLPPAFAWTCCGLSVVLCADTFSKLAGRLYTPRRHWGTLPAPGAFFFYRWLGGEWRRCLPVEDPAAEDHFSLKLPEMWLWPALRRQIIPLAMVAGLIAWLGSGVHEIAAGFSGVRHTLGKWDARSLPPGFHLSLPWPLGGVRPVDTGKVHETVLGFRADPGRPILWERAHYEGEQLSLVGGGDDFLSISVPIHYRIADPAAYIRGAADPERLVRDAGGRLLLDLTLHRSAAEIMTIARESIRGDFHARLQSDLDREHSGVEIEQVCLRDVHPAVEVAPS